MYNPSLNNKFNSLQNYIQDKLQTTVKVDQRSIVIKYMDENDLNRILELLNLLED